MGSNALAAQKYRNIWRECKAASTVLAVILLVVIGVVATVAAYYFLIATVPDSMGKPNFFPLNQKKAILEVITGPTVDSTWDEYIFVVQNAGNRYELDPPLSGGVQAGQKIDMESVITSSGLSFPQDDIPVSFVYKTNNQVLGDYIINVPTGAPQPVPAGPAPWWELDWAYRKKLTINHEQVEEDVTEFPVLVSINNDPDLKDHVEIGGRDIAFVSLDGTNQFNHEIEKYDTITGTLVTWVKLPSISASEDTVFYLYYGNPTCGPQENAQGTWNKEYELVYHMDGATLGQLTDSTSNNHNPSEDGGGGGVGPSYHRNGKIGYAVGFDGSDYIRIPPSADFELQEFSINMLIYSALGANTGLTLWAYQPANCENRKNGFQFRDNIVQFGDATVAMWSMLPRIGGHTTGVWTLLTCVYDGEDMILYVNGEENNRVTDTIDYSAEEGKDSNPAETLLSLGGYFTSAQYQLQFRGFMDEIRYVSNALSPGWLKTSSNTMLSPESFITVGAEEVPE